MALRVARAATGRRLCLNFEGHYHGWSDGILASYHPSPEQLSANNGIPIAVSAGQLPPDELLIAECNRFPKWRKYLPDKVVKLPP
jgi:glutamate-1-semialdehyde 2,1-aminomutase